MEITFIVILDLTPNARIRYTSDAVEDILDYQPNDVVNRSLWDYLHPDEMDLAQEMFAQSISHDLAAGLAYFQVKHKLGSWVGVECVFTVVYDALVASVSIYQRGSKSQKRAADAPVVQRLFASSPLDPRYDMISHVTSKFSQIPRTISHEPRAALFLNRFTRSSTIMFATSSVSHILGLTPADLVSKSFYYCIEQCCLHEAVRCIESAKANDTIAYLRFWFRNPLLDEDSVDDEGDSSDEDEEEEDDEMDDDDDLHNSRGSEDFDQLSRESSSPTYPGTALKNINIPPTKSRIEVEAVISCSSDGLVVVLRRARPSTTQFIDKPGCQVYPKHVFASPWGTDSIPPASKDDCRKPVSSSQPAQGELMDTIRDVAVLAWAVVGTNGSLRRYGQGNPMGESQPPDGSVGSSNDSASEGGDD
ncbi:hypothetical protein FQN50_002027 [Emmonsiellopsis sp. PD_5]|nr:hypothetical protein FQN50_002027 [Emmonsiellopsis sp. PD_5]